MNAVIRWPKLLTPTQLSEIIRDQRNPLTALKLFNQANTKYPNYKHNGPVYATMINILANSGRLSEMKTLIHQMKHDSCECKDSTFASAGSLCKNLQQFNCVNWNESFNTLFEIMMEQSRFEDAYKLYLENSMGWEVKHRIYSLNLFIGALCRRNRSDLAFEVFQEMNSQFCCPDRDTYRDLMRGLCVDGRLNEATHLLYSMFWRISQKGSGEDIVVYRTLLETLVENGQVEDAVEVLGKVLRKGLKIPKQRRQGFSLTRFLEMENLDEVKGLMNEALIKGVVPSLVSYSAMAVDLYSEGKIEDANRVFDIMQERGYLPSVTMYEAKIEALCREGRADLAVQVIEEEMVKGNCVATSGTYKLLVKGLCNEGKSMIGVKYLEKMKQMGGAADKEFYHVLVDGLCRENRIVEACKVLEKMLNRKYWPSAAAYNKLIGGLCGLGRRYEAVLWLEEMASQGDFPDVLVWNSLVKLVCSDSNEPSIEMLQQVSNFGNQG
ncbi:hypothetical protein ACHQM5_000018 [Ranunculus cassubicifolius]